MDARTVTSFGSETHSAQRDGTVDGEGPSPTDSRVSADRRTLLARGAAERMLLASAIILVLWLAVAWALA